jgi:hypothetical protein
MTATQKPTRLDRLLKKLGACSDAREWAKDYKTPAAAWAACENPEWMLWVLNSCDLINDRNNRLFACGCVRNTPLADGRKVWDLLTDERSRTAVEVAERFADGNATEEELDAARTAAWAAARAAGAAQANQIRTLYGNPFTDRKLLTRLENEL